MNGAGSESSGEESMSKQLKRLTKKQKKDKHGTVAAYYESLRHKAAVKLNQELNKVTSSILKNTKDLDPEFSKTVDENFWDLA